MNGSEGRLFLRAGLLGIVAGMRSMAAPALVSRIAAERRHRSGLLGTPLATLERPEMALTLQAMALGELVVDKLPNTPARTSPPSLIIRALSGAVVGYAAGGKNERARAAGAIIGAAAAVGATFAAYHLRKSLGEETGLPDTVFAFAEDALAVGIGTAALQIAE